MTLQGLGSAATTSSDDSGKKIRKPYTITKSRESWTEQEHDKFLEALQLYYSRSFGVEILWAPWEEEVFEKLGFGFGGVEYEFPGGRNALSSSVSIPVFLFFWVPQVLVYGMTELCLLICGFGDLGAYFS